MKQKLDIVKVFPEIDLIQDEALHRGTIAVWEQLWEESKWENIMDLPCSTHKTDYPHVIHNRSVVRMAIHVAETLKEFHHVDINMDHLIAAALLQDASKLVEYEPTEDGGCVMSELGKTFAHSFYAGHVALNHGIPYDVAQVILPHSPDSPVYPQTLICKILFYVDQTDMAAIGGDRWRKMNVTYR